MVYIGEMLLTLIHTHRFPGEAELAGSHLDLLSRLCILTAHPNTSFLSQYFGLPS